MIIVGAGPAGVRAAAALSRAGLRPIVIDEGRRDGGQIYRRQPEAFHRSYVELYGTEAKRAADLHETFEALEGRIDYRPDTLAWSVSENRLHVLNGTDADALPFDALIIAAGATDRVMPVRGWNIAGTYGLGGAQIALKAQACAIGREIAFLGSGPLLYLVAVQYLEAGAKVAAVLDTSPFHLRLKALPQLMARPDVLVKGLALVAQLKRARVKIHTGVTPIEIGGSVHTGVESVSVRLLGGATRTICCDAVALGHHLRPETQLADLAGCEFRFDAETRQWLPLIDREGRTTIAGVYLAGDGARVLGADGAEAAGRLAALAALTDAKRDVPPGEMARLGRTLDRMDRFRRGLAQAFPWPHEIASTLSDDTVVCRCELVTAGELRDVVCEKGAGELNRAKAFSRVGMGRCQGRYCGHAAAEVVAAAVKLPLEQVGRLRSQAPIKPLIIGAEAKDT